MVMIATAAVGMYCKAGMGDKLSTLPKVESVAETAASVASVMAEGETVEDQSKSSYAGTVRSSLNACITRFPRRRLTHCCKADALAWTPNGDTEAVCLIFGSRGTLKEFRVEAGRIEVARCGKSSLCAAAASLDTNSNCQS